MVYCLRKVNTLNALPAGICGIPLVVPVDKQGAKIQCLITTASVSPHLTCIVFIPIELCYEYLHRNVRLLRKLQVQAYEPLYRCSLPLIPFSTFFRWDWSWNLFYGHSLPSADSRREVVSYLRKNVRWVLVNRLIGLSLPRKSVVRLTDRPNMTLAVDRGR